MAESLTPHQINRVKELGAWRDEGRLFEVGLDGEVSEHHEEKEIDDGHARQGAAGREGTAGRKGAAASGAPADAEPAGADRRQTLRERYLGFRPEILLYYPTAHFREVDHGHWIVVRIYPLGRDGPCYWVCLFLPDEAVFSPKAFAFERLSPVPRAVGVRHTNFPDASICAFTDDDDAWRPGDNPKILLNLYAEWLICQLFLRLEHYWPGRQVGLDAIYRSVEFTDRDWCDCGSEKRYGDCHCGLDQAEVVRLKASGEYVPLPDRVVPQTILKFAKSRWKKLPDLARLPMHQYSGKPPRE
ncbi:MAG TPA: hypothetical protein VMN38_00915 [Sphingomicrobium sp.]|nr:hypothetical protein [Sphingomicrobium sp.]